MDNINLQTKKIFLYARKSTDEPERQVLSIEAQMFELREYAKKEGLNIVREFVESKTAKEPGREIFNEMLGEIEKGNAQGILAWNPDRLARNSIDGGRVIYLVDTQKITSLKFPTFWFEATPQGKFMLSVALGKRSITPTICEKTFCAEYGRNCAVANCRAKLLWATTTSRDCGQ